MARPALACSAVKGPVRAAAIAMETASAATGQQIANLQRVLAGIIRSAPLLITGRFQ